MVAPTEDHDVRILTPCLLSRPISLLLALSACAAAGAAPAARPTTAPEPLPAAPSPPARALPAPAAAGSLDRALDAVQATKIRSDEFFIASDELGGRDTPSLGQRVAARYIRARLERLGWKPGAKEGGYFFPYALDPRKIDEQASTLAWKGGKSPAAEGELRFGDDYFFTSSFDCKELAASGSVVFCGDASKADFEKCGVSGKWALVVDDGTELRKMRAPGKRAGAVGVILAAAAGSEPYEKRYGKDLESLRRGHLAPRRTPAKGEEDSDKSDPVYPVVLLERPALTRLFSAAGAPAEGPAAGTDLGLVLTETRKLAPLVEVEDVCGFWPGSDPVLAKETILVSAHYDHVGTRNGQIYNGADDNGSGTCGLMAIAEALANYGPMRRSVMLIWVSGEEKGLWGSAAWTKDPWIPDGGKPICDINIDMIGRNAPDKLLITPTRELPQYNGLVRIAEKVGPLEGFPKLGSCDEYWRRSDHMNFSDNLKIPVCFLFSDVHEDYHQPTDKPEKIDNDKIRRVSRMVLRMLEELQADHLEL